MVRLGSVLAAGFYVGTAFSDPPLSPPPMCSASSAQNIGGWRQVLNREFAIWRGVNEPKDLKTRQICKYLHSMPFGCTKFIQPGWRANASSICQMVYCSIEIDPQNLESLARTSARPDQNITWIIRSTGLQATTSNLDARPETSGQQGELPSATMALRLQHGRLGNAKTEVG
jgi:hypothetical protein